MELNGRFTREQPVLSGAIRGAPITFSFKTSGYEGGAHSALDITIENDGCAQTSVEVNGGDEQDYHKVALRFAGDWELESVVKGLEFLAKRLGQLLPIEKRTTFFAPSNAAKPPVRRGAAA